MDTERLGQILTNKSIRNKSLMHSASGNGLLLLEVVKPSRSNDLGMRAEIRMRKKL
jgi:hypothetical protein